MFTDNMLDSIWICGTIVKWFLFPACEAWPMVQNASIGVKRLIILLLSLGSSLLVYSGDFQSTLIVGFSSALVAVGQHHLFKLGKEK